MKCIKNPTGSVEINQQSDGWRGMYQKSDEGCGTYLKSDGRRGTYQKVECIKNQMMGVEHNQKSDGRALIEVMLAAGLTELMLCWFAPQKSLREPPV